MFNFLTFICVCVCVCVALSWEGFSGVRAVALPGDFSYAANHGVFLSDQQVILYIQLLFKMFYFCIFFSVEHVDDVLSCCS